MSEKYEKETEKNGNFDRAIGLLASAAGLALGLNTGEPFVTVVGGKTLEILLKEIVWRWSPREKTKASKALEFAAQEVQRRLDSGEEPRKDWIFSDKEEVLEAVLLKVQREPEEKKIRYTGYIFAGSLFESQISAYMVHHVIKAAEQLTYRQLCILKLCAVKDNYELRDKNYREFEIESLSKDLYEVLHECGDLHNKEYIHSGLDTATMEMNVLSRLRSIVPSDMAFHTIGDYLYNLMKLSEIPDEDIAPIAEQLRVRCN